jgi:hypothetical protein
MTLPYFIYFIKRALDFCKVTVKLLEMTFKGKKNLFPHYQPLHFLIYSHSEAHMMPVAIHSQQETLIWTLRQQGSLAIVQVVVSFMLSLFC